ncbi:hypothetical protein ElyMa_001063800 [Elysia marginata]|uniref:Uncharacterized protein n=1 Tax=Elysia marginata TaxID=1093978 RepID=A0AAV4HPL3_9GAST|nr:hypothetical protein ElyMa_001063800 [Elysia marginata]
MESFLDIIIQNTEREEGKKKKMILGGRVDKSARLKIKHNQYTGKPSHAMFNQRQADKFKRRRCYRNRAASKQSNTKLSTHRMLTNIVDSVSNFTRQKTHGFFIPGGGKSRLSCRSQRETCAFQVSSNLYTHTHTISMQSLSTPGVEYQEQAVSSDPADTSVTAYLSFGLVCRYCFEDTHSTKLRRI